MPERTVALSTLLRHGYSHALVVVLESQWFWLVSALLLGGGDLSYVGRWLFGVGGSASKSRLASRACVSYRFWPLGLVVAVAFSTQLLVSLAAVAGGSSLCSRPGFLELLFLS
ncbi:hypothetical protein F2Q68_00001602 [Brassica cretica]|uniref:Uncharacterized protein n=1 Tax=Brassica cretica TaxID=69181 RepID=A0A8S9JHI2_BRACR|nr:hypothetical protein F2Q68_00001602 [Brassica cretica]